MIDTHTGRDAELFRRRHCDGPHATSAEDRRGSHECVGTITIKPGHCLFDCPLCGQESVDLRPARQEMDEGRGA